MVDNHSLGDHGVFERLYEDDSLRERFVDYVESSFSWVDQSQQHYENQLAFAIHRIDEGLQVLQFFEPLLKDTRDARVLDIGSGNGGVILPFANAGYWSCAFDIVPNPDVRNLRKTLSVPVSAIVGRDALPFENSSFSLVLLLDVIEHVAERRLMGSEIMRILRPGGQCMITTPARLRHLFGKDPHFGVPWILMLPNELQRFIVDRVARRSVTGSDGKKYPAYDVEHIFWHVREVTRLFPGPKEVQVLFNRPLHKGRPLSRSWLSFKLRDFFWDRIVITKAERTAVPGA